MAHLGAAAADLLTDRDKLVMLVAGGSALALGVYGARCVVGLFVFWLINGGGVRGLERGFFELQHTRTHTTHAPQPCHLKTHQKQQNNSEGARVAGRAAERWLGTPKLVRETSRWSLFGGNTKAGRSASSGGGEKTADAVKKDFSDIVLPGELHDRVRSLAAVAANTKRHGAPFRHMLFYGPPGTGKTLVAKRLARTSGCEAAARVVVECFAVLQCCSVVL
jgi:hypothetical protein